MTSPNAVELLIAARAALLDEVLPVLPDPLRYSCRMIASALAIAAREIDLDKRSRDIESDALSRLLAPAERDGLMREDALAVLSRRIRQGELDPLDAGRDPAWTALMAITRARLAISNPKVLDDSR